MTLDETLKLIPEIKSMVEKITATQQKEFISPEELEELFGIKVSTQAKMRHQRELPYYKFGKAVRYKYDEIVDFIMQHKVPAIKFSPHRTNHRTA